MGQFLATANNYNSSGTINFGANSIGLLVESTAGSLLLGAAGTSGVVNINTGGYSSTYTRLSISAAGLVTLSSLASTGSATGKTVVCADASGNLYRSSSGSSCAN